MGVGEITEAGAVAGYKIQRAREVGDFGTIKMVALMNGWIGGAGDRRSGGCNGTFCCQASVGVLLVRSRTSQFGQFDDGAGEFEIGIGNGGSGVRPTDKIRCDRMGASLLEAAPGLLNSWDVRSCLSIKVVEETTLVRVNQGRRGNEI
jgi:hypothetical protein